VVTVEVDADGVERRLIVGVRFGPRPVTRPRAEVVVDSFNFLGGA
jgi:hypothetical protein